MIRPGAGDSPRRRRAAGIATGAIVAMLGMCAGPRRASAFDPAVGYALHCQGCHLADGRATPGLVPALDETVAGFASRPLGRDYLVRLPNVASAPISDADLATLLNWVVDRFGGDGRVREAPFTGMEVARLRIRPLVDVESARREAVAGQTR